MLDARRLLILLAVAREGSLAAAARAMAVTQPAISQHIRQLEREAGVPLVLRRGRSVVLTDAARRLIPHAEAVAARLAAADAELASAAGGVAGAVSVAAFPSASATLVLAALDLVSTQHPDIAVSINDAEPPEAIDQLRRGEVNLAVAFTYGALPPSTAAMTTVPLFEERLYALVHRDHPAAARPSLHLADLSDETFIGGCPRCRQHLVAAAEAAGIVANVSHSTDDYVVTQALVARRRGVALLPRLATHAFFNQDTVAVPVEDVGMRSVYAVVAREEMWIAPVAAMLEALRTAVARLADTVEGLTAARP